MSWHNSDAIANTQLLFINYIGHLPCVEHHAVIISFQKPFLFEHQSIILSDDHKGQLWTWQQVLEEINLICQMFYFSFLLSYPRWPQDTYKSISLSLASLWNTVSVHCHRTSNIIKESDLERLWRVCPPWPAPLVGQECQAAHKISLCAAVSRQEMTFSDSYLIT